MRILVAGDTHGNTIFINKVLYPAALRYAAEAVVVVGDFGYWEHEPSGVDFLDLVDVVAGTHDIPCFWLRGNHDNVAELRRRYDVGDGQHFVDVRPHVHFIPDGMVWQWGGRRLRAFGGAYSTDKQFRLGCEVKRQHRLETANLARVAAGFEPYPNIETAGTLWFPDEEMDAGAFARMVEFYSGPVDLVFSHDRPMGADVPWLRLTGGPEFDRTPLLLHTALRCHQPRWWIHGHLHSAYTVDVRSGDDDMFTTVVSLGCDSLAASRFSRPEDAWCLVDLLPSEPITVTLGRKAER